MEERMLKFLRLEAKNYSDKGDKCSALAILRKALKIEPNNIFTLTDRAVIYADIQYYQKAYEDLLRCLNIDDTNEKLWNYVFDLMIAQAKWYERKGYYATALCCLNRFTLPDTIENKVLIDKFEILKVKRRILESKARIKRTRLSSAPELKSFYATRVFNATSDNEVSFKKGDIIADCYLISDGWMMGTVLSSKKTGWLPERFIELFE